MRTFAAKQKATQQTKSAKRTIPSRAHFGQSHEVNSILHLHRTIENQAVQRMLQTNAEKLEVGLARKALPRFEHDFSRIPVHPPAAGAIQTKLAINKPGDEYEQEANRIAEQVMRMLEPQSPRACACGGGCPKCQTVRPGWAPERVQTKRAQASDMGRNVVPPIVHQVLAASGQPLDAGTRTFMEPRFGADFSQVQVHTGREAAESARKIGARAYTMGSHIVFGDGEYAPASHAGCAVLTHELAHVVQQGGGRTASVLQRREVDDRSCDYLADIESDVDTEVNSEIAAARTEVATHTAAGAPINVLALAQTVFKRLGDGIISPIESFVENLPPSKRKSPPSDLKGTKYSGAAAVKSVYHFAHGVVASAAKVHDVCIGADKLGHFFDLGFRYWLFNRTRGLSPAEVESGGRASEITIAGLGLTGVYSNADLEANRRGFQFYKDLEADPSGLSFGIKNYISSMWNEQVNPSFYESALAEVVWSNLLTGKWRGTITHSNTPAPIPIELDLTATKSSVTGTYEWPAGATKPEKGQITAGTIKQMVTSVSGDFPSSSPTSPPTPSSATPVSGVSIEFDWKRRSFSGKGVLNSMNEQTLEGTWGSGASRTGGGVLHLNKV